MASRSHFEDDFGGDFAGPNSRRTATAAGARAPTLLKSSIHPPPFTGSSSMLKLAAAYPMYTVQQHELNTFIPDSTMLFHVLSNCDALMIHTDRFTRTSPAWLPIVSQLYVSVLWNFMILNVQSNSSTPGHSSSILSQINKLTNLLDCLIPGPLVPFFQALGSTNGPYPWMANICPILPRFNELWNAGFYANPNFVRLVPIPAVILDQLHYFATWIPQEGQTVHADFQWYRNVFSQGLGAYNRLNRLGPQLAGSLHASAAQIDNARTSWGSALSSEITCTDAANAAFTKYIQLFGFVSQTNVIQCDWFSHVSVTMHRYAQYFNDSVPLRSIRFTGNGNVAVRTVPRPLPAVRDWLYPADNAIEPFLASRSAPRREVPSAMQIVFQHAHHTLPIEAEKYAILTQVNFQLPEGIETQNNWTAINDDAIHAGAYWEMPCHRTSVPVSAKYRYSLTIINRFYQPNGYYKSRRNCTRRGNSDDLMILSLCESLRSCEDSLATCQVYEEGDGGLYIASRSAFWEINGYARV